LNSLRISLSDLFFFFVFPFCFGSNSELNSIFGLFCTFDSFSKNAFMSLFKIYGSSAGSGKTFTLTKEYLKLVLNEEDPRYFQRILAITFTNDAANEMKVRILKALKEISDNEVSDSLIFKIIAEELPKVSNETLKSRAVAIYYEILHDYNDFAVKTIDSFVNQIVSSFTFDLDLPFNYEINLDQSQILSEAVDNLLDKIGKNHDLSQLLLDFALNKIEEDKSWNTLIDEIKQFGINIFENEGSYLIEKNLDLSLADIKKIKGQIIAFQKSVLTRIKESAQSGLDLIFRSGLTEEDFSYKKSGVFGFYEKLASMPEDLFFSDTPYPKSRHIDAFENGKWYGKAAQNAGIIDGIKSELVDVANRILELKTDKYFILNEVNKNLLKIPLLAMIKEEMDIIKSDRNEVFLSEFNKKILDIVVKEPVPFIYERIGEKYDHLLIDEFQDTSNMQFFNLLPLIDNAISKNKANLIVGDPKQAIYKWRGGNIQLMIDLIQKNVSGLLANIESGENQAFQLENVTFSGSVESLNVNYRSKTEIINFNNSFFDTVVQSNSSEFPLVESVFSDYFQNVPPIAKEGGYVSVEFIEKQTASILEKVLSQVNQILDDGFKPGDIAILCRRNSEGFEVADFLQKNGFEINSVDSLKIWKNLEVSFLVSALKFIQQPDAMFSRFEFLQFFKLLQPQTLQNLDLKELCKLPLDDFLSTEGIDIGQVFEKDFYSATEYLIEKFELLSNSSSINYIFTFLDVLLQFYHKKSKNLVDFLAHWELKKEKFSINNKSENAITVTSIHKSKGLEYPIVILPYLNWNTSPRVGSELWVDISMLNYSELASGEKTLQATPLKVSLKKNLTFGRDILETHEELIFIENLNMLYVALTRPVERLYIWCHFKVGAKGMSVDGLGSMFQDFLLQKGLLNIGQLQYGFGQTNLKIQKADSENIEDVYNVDFNKIFEKEFPLKLKTESNFKSLEREQKITLGNLIHAAFELIKTKSDIETALQKLSAEGYLDEMHHALLEQKILQVIENNKVSQLFSEKALVKNEIEILSKGQNVQRPDRIVFVADKVYILDYKTGEKTIHHRKQIQNYGYLIGQMGYKNIHLIIIYLEPFEIVKFPLAD
jgi:ATP-dependent helicase/nuclease subunit A